MKEVKEYHHQMHEVVRDAVWKDLAATRDERAIYDPELYQKVFEKHYLDAFETFCAQPEVADGPFAAAVRRSFDTPAGFDANEYARHCTARRHVLNQFIRQKPYVVVVDDRFFTLTFFSEVEVRIDELTSNDVAEALNDLLRPRSLVATVRAWFSRRSGRLKR